MEKEKKDELNTSGQTEDTKANRDEPEAGPKKDNDEEGSAAAGERGRGQQDTPEEPKRTQDMRDVRRSLWRLLPDFSHKLTVDMLNPEIIEADIFEAKTRVRRLTAGSDREHFLGLLDEARNALAENQPRFKFARRLVETVNNNIGFRLTLLPHLTALIILFIYFAGIAFLAWRIFLAEAFGTAVWNIFLSFTIGGAGGAVSLALDFRKIFRPGEPSFIALIRVALRPLIGAFLAAFIFSLISSKYLNPIIPPIIQISFDELSASELFYVLLSMSFLFGFSERIPTMIIERATKIAEQP